MGEQPLVRVEHQAVGELGAAHQVAELGTDHRAAGPGGIDVKEHPVPLCHRGDRLDRVAGADAGAAQARDDGGRHAPGLPVGPDRRVEGVRVHAVERAGHGDPHQVGVADAGDAHRLVDGGMDLLRGVDPQGRSAREAGRVAGEAERPLARGEEGGERRARGRILDHAGKGFRQADHLAQPVHHPGLELGRGRRGLPEHALRGERCGDELRHQGGRAGIGREVGEEARVLPMGHARHHHPVEIGKDPLHRLARGGRGLGQLAEDLAGGHLRPHRPLADAFEVIHRPVGGPVRPGPKRLVVHRVRAPPDGPVFRCPDGGLAGFEERASPRRARGRQSRPGRGSRRFPADSPSRGRST